MEKMDLSRRNFIKKSSLLGSIVFLPALSIAESENSSSGIKTIKKLTIEIKSPLKINSKSISDQQPGWYSSFYTNEKSLRLRSGHLKSDNNGKTWEKSPMTPDFMADLPYGYRRDSVVSVLDSNTNKIISIINALDVPDLDPNILEPPIALETYYLRYRVSTDSGKSWLFDEPIIQKGDYSKDQPLDDVFIGKNSIFIGDIGSIPIITRNKKILVPAQITPLGDDGKLYNPGKGHTYHDAVVLIGTWIDNNRIEWQVSERIIGDPAKSTRGMIEPTILEMEDNRLVMVMRGSNDANTNLPGYKWISISNDEGISWSEPEPFTLDDGVPFYSPSAMSTLFKHSSGRCFWIGNLTQENPHGNLPRWPLVIAELDKSVLKLKKETLLILDTYDEVSDKLNGRLDLSHFWLIEDRESGEIILTYPRSYHAYKSREWITTRIQV